MARCFDEYVSLGDNCEAGLNFFRIGYDYGSVFRFSVTPFSSLLRVLRNDFSGLYDVIEPLADNMVQCGRYGISFHTMLRSKEVDGVRRYLSGLDVESIHRSDILKLRYLEQKFRTERNEGKRILYFVKSSKKIPDGDLLELKSYLDGYGKGGEIVCLSEKCVPREVASGVHIRPVEFFAPSKNAHAFCVDSWDLIFDEFPLASGKCKSEPIRLKIEL